MASASAFFFTAAVGFLSNSTTWSLPFDRFTSLAGNGSAAAISFSSAAVLRKSTISCPRAFSRCGSSSRAKLTERIERALAKSLGYEVVVFLRTAPEIKAIAANEPFPAKLVDSSQGKLQVALLPKKPAPAVRKKALALATDEDRLAFGDRELYWLPSGGTRDSGLDLKGLEKQVGAWTMRTKGTIELLAEKFFD